MMHTKCTVIIRLFIVVFSPQLVKSISEIRFHSRRVRVIHVRVSMRKSLNDGTSAADGLEVGNALEQVASLPSNSF